MKKKKLKKLLKEEKQKVKFLSNRVDQLTKYINSYIQHEQELRLKEHFKLNEIIFLSSTETIDEHIDYPGLYGDDIKKGIKNLLSILKYKNTKRGAVRHLFNPYAGITRIRFEGIISARNIGHPLTYAL